MILLLQNQAAAISQEPLKLYEQIALHSLAAVLTAGCVVLLIRTVGGTLHSRFLKHLTVSVALNVMFRLGSITYLLLEYKFSQYPEALKIISSTWEGIDITISLLASWFLITTWHLLRRYPNEGVDRAFYTTLTAAFGAISLAVLTNLKEITELVQSYIWTILKTIDVLAAAAGLILVGIQLGITLRPKMKTQSLIWRATLPGMTTFVYVVWGAFQPLYYSFKGTSWYSILLVMAGVSAIIMTVILCSQTLEEKPEYNSNATFVAGTKQDVITPLSNDAKSG